MVYINVFYTDMHITLLSNILLFAAFHYSCSLLINFASFQWIWKLLVLCATVQTFVCSRSTQFAYTANTQWSSRKTAAQETRDTKREAKKKCENNVWYYKFRPANFISTMNRIMQQYIWHALTHTCSEQTQTNIYTRTGQEQGKRSQTYMSKHRSSHTLWVVSSQWNAAAAAAENRTCNVS